MSASIYGATATPQDTTPQILGGFSFRNKIINGDLELDQRNGGAAVSTNNLFPADRWQMSLTGGGVFSAQQQSAIVPAGARAALLMTVTTPDAAIAATDLYFIQQKIEGPNATQFKFGTSSAGYVTLSFWAYSSIVGTYSVLFGNSAANRSYPATYTINSVNTWEYKTVTILGDVTGTWAFDTGSTGLKILFCLGAGTTFQGNANQWNAGNFPSSSAATQWIATNGAVFGLSLVQLEEGQLVTPFERRQRTTELALCSRYYQKSFLTGTAVANNAGIPGANAANQLVGASTATALPGVRFPVEMRATPTVVLYNPSAANSQIRNTTAGSDWTLSASSNVSAKAFELGGTTPGGSSASQVASVHWSADAEL